MDHFPCETSLAILRHHRIYGVDRKRIVSCPEGFTNMQDKTVAGVAKLLAALTDDEREVIFSLAASMLCSTPTNLVPSTSPGAAPR